MNIKTTILFMLMYVSVLFICSSVTSAQEKKEDKNLTNTISS